MNEQLIGTVWMHLRTRGIYTIVGTCQLEYCNAPAFLYRAWKDGTVWARSQSEFLDGRFEMCRIRCPNQNGTRYRRRKV